MTIRNVQTRRLAAPVLGLRVVLLLVVRAPLATRLGLAGVANSAYLVAGLPVILVTEANGRNWPWMLGSLACFAAVAFLTPADPVTMLMVAAPLCFCCSIVAAASRIRGSAVLVVGPVLLIGGIVTMIGGFALSAQAHHSSIALELTNPLVRMFAPLGLLAGLLDVAATNSGLFVSSQSGSSQ